MGQHCACFHAKTETSGVIPPWSWGLPSGRLDFTDGTKDKGEKKAVESVL